MLHLDLFMFIVKFQFSVLLFKVNIWEQPEISTGELISEKVWGDVTNHDEKKAQLTDCNYPFLKIIFIKIRPQSYKAMLIKHALSVEVRRCTSTQKTKWSWWRKHQYSLQFIACTVCWQQFCQVLHNLFFLAARGVSTAIMVHTNVNLVEIYLATTVNGCNCNLLEKIYVM